MKRFTLPLLAALLFSLAACGSPEKKISLGPAVRDLDGRVIQPLNMAGRRAVVLVFVTSQCPISNTFAPEISRIAAEYQPRSVVLYVIHADPDTTADDARKHAAEFALMHLPVLIDRGHRFAFHTGATVTPEAAVVDPAGRVVYLGRINNLFADFGVKRAAPTTRDLREALDAVLAGKPVPNPRTPAIGCAIADLK